MSREVMTMALEALKNLVDRGEWHDQAGYQAFKNAEQAIAAIKEALAQPDNTAKLYEELRSVIDGGSESFTHKDAVQYLKDNLAPLKWTPEDTAYRPGGLAQAEQGPVAWGCNRYIEDDNGFQIGTDEPELAWGKYAPDDNGWWPLYTSPPQRQPLTDAEIWQMVNDCSFNRDLHADKFARAIEAAHGIKPLD